MTLPYVSIGKILESNKDNAHLSETFPFVQSILLRLKIAFRVLVSRSLLTFLNLQFCKNSTPTVQAIRNITFTNSREFV